ncbi:MAG: hypothetical protein KDA81_05400, partial [Planctomycetaceae bacterium]|nr:hypothetical protein [Planctomycetaceae bacterium]
RRFSAIVCRQNPKRRQVAALQGGAVQLAFQSVHHRGKLGGVCPGGDQREVSDNDLFTPMPQASPVLAAVNLACGIA